MWIGVGKKLDINETPKRKKKTKIKSTSPWAH